MLKIDWLHVMDLGVSSCLFGAVLHMAVARGQYGPNQATRAKALFRLMLAFYDQNRVIERLKLLPVKRFK
eukprot:1580982-Amphidinium_carterae.1